MLKLLIADDEAYVREYMKTVLDWESMGITICGCARDSAEAIEIAEKEMPDMALLDINMPEMDGLELTERLLKMAPDLVMAFVTGYSEFEYARKALQLGAEEYILKPFSPEELESAVRRLKMKIEKRVQERCDSRKDREVLRESLLREILTSRDFLNIADWKERMKRVGIRFPYGCFLAAQMEIHFTDQIQEPDLGLWKFSIRNILEEYPVIPDTVLYVADGGAQKISLLMNGTKESLSLLNLKQYFEDVQKAIWEYLKLLVTIGVGETKESLERLYDSVREGEKACRVQEFQGTGKLYFYTEVQAERKKPSSRRAQEIIRAVEEAIRENYQEPDLNVEKIAELVFLDASYIRRIFSKYRGCTVVDFLTEYRMQEAKKLLQAGKLSVSQAAEQVGYMDPGYFTKCFKKHFGVTPSNYLDFSHSNPDFF